MRAFPGSSRPGRYWSILTARPETAPALAASKARNCSTRPGGGESRWRRWDWLFGQSAIHASGGAFCPGGRPFHQSGPTLLCSTAVLHAGGTAVAGRFCTSFPRLFRAAVPKSERLHTLTARHDCRQPARRRIIVPAAQLRSSLSDPTGGYGPGRGAACQEIRTSGRCRRVFVCGSITSNHGIVCLLEDYGSCFAVQRLHVVDRTGPEPTVISCSRH